MATERFVKELNILNSALGPETPTANAICRYPNGSIWRKHDFPEKPTRLEISIVRIYLFLLERQGLEPPVSIDFLQNIQNVISFIEQEM